MALPIAGNPGEALTMQPDDTDVLVSIYQTTASLGAPPRAEVIATSLASTTEAVFDALRRLSGRRLLALAPGTGEIVMAPPFSAVPTPFEVSSVSTRYFANCAWDALGISAALHKDVAIRTSCACCGEPILLRIESGAPVPEPCIAHFAVAAAHWWDDIVYT
jgi:hypothetical protein